MFSLINRIALCESIIRRCIHVAQKGSNPRSAEAIFVERTLEEPIIVVTETENVDMIGPPDPVSNLRPIVRRKPQYETALQDELRQQQDSVQAWNHRFWAEHNTNFLRQRQTYIKAKRLDNGDGSGKTLTADEMSEFYKKFLDDNWHTHVRYNFEWYRKNFGLLLLAIRASLDVKVNRYFFSMKSSGFASLMEAPQSRLAKLTRLVNQRLGSISADV